MVRMEFLFRHSRSLTRLRVGRRTRRVDRLLLIGGLGYVLRDRRAVVLDPAVGGRPRLTVDQAPLLLLRRLLFDHAVIARVADRLGVGLYPLDFGVVRDLGELALAGLEIRVILDLKDGRKNGLLTIYRFDRPFALTLD